MPLYEYRCESCQTVNEIHHKISEAAPNECPKCQGGPLTKLISKTGFVLKGAGWYSDGYSGQSNKKPASSSSSEKSTKSETKPESKPAAKPAPATKKD